MLLRVIVECVSQRMLEHRRAAYEYFRDTVRHPSDCLDSGMGRVSRRQRHDSYSSRGCSHFAGASLLS